MQLDMPHVKDIRAKCLPKLGKKWKKTDHLQEFKFS